MVVYFTPFQAAKTQSKVVAGMGEGSVASSSTSGGSQKGTQRRGGGKKQGKVKSRDRQGSGSQWELQFMSITEV